VGILGIETMQKRARQALKQADQGWKTPERAGRGARDHMILDRIEPKS
jgi:hypothetical protein